ncbi:MAG: hypothetical protein ACYTGQ_13745 [Planctomycetota bacterium]|jgi:hypothetical protein
MTATDNNKGPWFHRFLIRLFTCLVALLVFWALGYVLSDIDRWEGPEYAQVEERMIDNSLRETEQRIKDDITVTKRSLADLNADQKIVSDSLANSRQTMNEMRETYRLALEQGVNPTPDQQNAQAESERLFLDNQRRYQQNTERIAQITNALRDLDQEQRDNKAALVEARKPISAEYNRLYANHNFKVACVKIGVLLPLLGLAVWLFVAHRHRLYAPLIHAFGIALVIHIGIVMHDYFPSEYFKYILIGVSLAVACWVLVHLLRMVAFPKKDWLIKQYREAYEAFLCPVCAHPIRRGPLKFRVWTRRSIRKPAFQSGTHTHNGADEGADEDTPYTCPVCTTRLYRKCDKCGATRAALLPACEHCGDTVEVGAAEPEP